MLLYCNYMLLYVTICYYPIISSYLIGITLDLPAAPRATSLSTWGQTRSLALTSSRRSLDVLLGEVVAKHAEKFAALSTQDLIQQH